MGAMNKIAVVIGILFLLVPGGAYCKESGNTGLVTPERVYSLIKEGSGMWLVDVRGRADYVKCHIEDSINISLEELRYKNLPKDKIMVIVDDSLGGMEAEDAESLLLSKGVKHVYVLQGGLHEWGRKGYPLSGSEAPGWALMPRPVTVEELKAAQLRGSPVKVYDFRGKGRKYSAMLKNFSSIMDKTTGRNLAARLKKPEQIVLVFSAKDDAERVAQSLSLNSTADIRYLLGGYQAVNARRGRKILSNSAGCPVCLKSGTGRAR